jgi:hypothetical protein
MGLGIASVEQQREEGGSCTHLFATLFPFCGNEKS